MGCARLLHGTWPAPDQPADHARETQYVLSRAHIALLVIIGKNVDRTGRSNPDAQKVATDKLAADWPSPPDLFAPAMSALEREGLINAEPEVIYGERYWKLLDYGNRFLDHLLIDDGGWPPAPAHARRGQHPRE